MFERFTPDARAIVVQAQQHARRLGHNFIGGEQLALAARAQPRAPRPGPIQRSISDSTYSGVMPCAARTALAG